jgi:hypothetical protein
MQREEQAVRRLQPLERATEHPPLECPVEIAVGCGCGQVELDDQTATARRAQGGPDHMTAEPCPERGRVAQSVEPAPGREQGLLDRVGGVRVRAGDDPGRPERRGEVRLDEVTERVAVAAACGGDSAGEGRR